MVLVLGLAAALFMVLAEVSNLYAIEVDTATCSDLADVDLADKCETTGASSIRSHSSSSGS